MNPGDKVKVVTKSEEFSGLLMPSSKKGVVVLKFDSGYNIGIDKKRIVKMTLLKKSRQVSADKGKASPKKGLPNVTILATGGTISSKIDYRTGAVHPSISAAQLTRDIPELKKIANIKCVALMNKLSEDIDLSDWKKISKAVHGELTDEKVSGVVVMHGTDTMHYTSAALSFMIGNLNKPVVLTGSQRSSDRGSSDAKINLLCSVQLAISNIAEVMLCMHGSINDDFCLAHKGTKVRKMHTSRRDAFQSVNAQPIAKVFPNGKIELISGGKRRSDTKPVLDTKSSANAGLLYAHGNISPKIIDWYVAQGYRGLVVMGTGMGHTPSKGFLNALKKRAKKDISIFMTSQCFYGRVNPHVYSTAREIEKAGVTYLKDMLPETALVKLMWALGHSQKEEDVKKLMLKNFSGEFETRSRIDQKLFKE